MGKTFRYLYHKNLFDVFTMNEFLVKVKYSCKTNDQKYYYNEWLINLTKNNTLKEASRKILAWRVR